MAYADVDQLKTYLGITDTGDDGLLSDLLHRSQKAIESFTGRIFEVSEQTFRYYTVGVDTDGRVLYLDEDLYSINAIVTNADAAFGTTLLATEYITHPRTITPYYAIELLGSSSNSWTYTTDPENGITVRGKWGYSEEAPYDIAHSCIRLAAYCYRQKDASVFDITAIPDAGVIMTPQGIPADVKIILNPYRKIVSFMRTPE
jgi:hypothetical protein